MGLLIGLAGYARTGKDTVGKILFEQGNFERAAWADTLREALYKLNPILSIDSTGKGAVLVDKHGKYAWLAEIVDEYGWDEAKSISPEIRTYLQRFGTDVGRAMFGENFWVEQTCRRLNIPDYGDDLDRNIVVTDCRFPSEAIAIKQRRGFVWRVERKGIGPANDHPSEIGLDEWRYDAIVPNNWTVEELEEIVLSNLRAEPYRMYLA